MGLTKSTKFTLDGTGKLSIAGGENYRWGNGWLSEVDLWTSKPGKNITATVTLAGHDWDMGTLRMGGSSNTNMILNDNTTGNGGSIETLSFGKAATINLDRTFVSFINARDDGVHDITLGIAGAHAIRLRGGDDTVRLTGDGDCDLIRLGSGDNTVINTGSRHLDFISADEGDDTVTLTGSNGGAGAIRLGDGDNTVNGGGGWIDSIEFYDGNSTINMGSGGLGSVRFGGSGTNTFVGGTGYVDAITGYLGDETVTVIGGVGMIRLNAGDNTVTTGSGFVNSIVTQEGNDTITTGVGGVGSVISWGGTNTVNVNGWVGVMKLDGDNTVTIDDGGMIEMLQFGSGDDYVTLAEIDDDDPVSMLYGSTGEDTLDFSAFTVDVNITLLGTGTANTTAGVFVIRGFENLTTGSGNDNLAGSADANILIGGGGNDFLNGYFGDDKLTGGTGADTFYYGANWGDDTITDFSIADGDKIDLTGIVAIDDFADLVANYMTQNDANTEIENDNGDVLVIANVTAANLTATQFIFA